MKRKQDYQVIEKKPGMIQEFLITKKIFITLLVTAAFCFGFAFNQIISKQFEEQITMKKVTGIGGVFFKSKDPGKLKEWYKEHLGLEAGPYGASFEWRQADDTSKKGSTQWNPFKESTKYFDPSTKDFMINYRVEYLVELVEQLKKDGVEIVDEMETYDYGKFIHIIDLDGNKVELWEPTD